MKMTHTPNTRCRAAFVRCDITPPIGIYHRMWGAALLDQATGVHRPLEATLFWLESANGGISTAQIVISLDHCILDTAEISAIRNAIKESTGVGYDSILVTLTHTHGSGWMSRSRSQLPGGELIGPYLDRLVSELRSLAVDAQKKVETASIVYSHGRCNLAAHRDYFDNSMGRYVCGYNPEGLADDTLLIGSVINESGKRLGTIVNYACHPTTLAWDNTLISPDWVGSMREVLEANEGGITLFLQGASGDLGPREGFVGDTVVADRNGRKVGFAALSAIANTPPPCTSFHYNGAVVSGTLIGTWKDLGFNQDENENAEQWRWEDLVIELPYRHDLPTIESTTEERDFWLKEETIARSAGDEPRTRHCRAEVEQRTRQLTRLNVLVTGRFYPLRTRIGLAGDCIWLFTPGELYQVFQLELRKRFAPRPVMISTLTNDWQPGYIPAASSFGYGIYQDVIAATSPGCLEILIESISRKLNLMLE